MNYQERVERYIRQHFGVTDIKPDTAFVEDADAGAVGCETCGFGADGYDFYWRNSNGTPMSKFADISFDELLRELCSD